jgi:hypothetical protein
MSRRDEGSLRMMAATRNLDLDDPTFVRDLAESQTAVWRVAQWLSARGQHVTVRAVRVRPTVEDIGEYGDLGDLEILQRVEVKQRRLAFTSVQDYPYPTVLVDVAHAWDRASPKPYAYVILNAAGTVAALVLGRTRARWRAVTRYDAAKQRHRTFYECPLACAQFVSLGEAPPPGWVLDDEEAS